MKPSPTATLINAMRILAMDVQSEDGVANAAIAEAAERLNAFHEGSIRLGQELLVGHELSFQENRWHLWVRGESVQSADTVEGLILALSNHKF